MLNWIKVRICCIVAALMTLPSLSAWGVTVSDSVRVKVFFPQGWSRINPGYRDNEKNLLDFIATVDSLSANASAEGQNVVHIRSASSPEGRCMQNLHLSQSRTKSTLAFIQAHSKAKDIIYQTESIGEDWEGLAQLLDTANFYGAQKAADIIRTTPYYVVENGKVVSGRKKMLMDMQGGRLWWKMNDLLFPELRSSSVSVWYTSTATPASAHIDSLPKLRLLQNEGKAIKNDSYVAALAPKVSASQIAVGDICNEDKSPVKSEGNLALRTNLLFDAATLVNCGVELPIGKSLSVEADVYFPWWQIPSKDITVQLMGGTIEGKYWFGDRSARPVMTGLFASLYAGAGYYDFQFGNGIQGELFIMGGLSVGYAHQIARNLHLEYSIGLGYIRTDYREYEPAKGTQYGDIKVRLYPWEEKRFSGVMPTKAAVSLVWIINSKKGGTR